MLTQPSLSLLTSHHACSYSASFDSAGDTATLRRLSNAPGGEFPSKCVVAADGTAYFSTSSYGAGSGAGDRVWRVDY